MNPNITKEQADDTMYENLKKYNKLLASLVRTALFVGNKLGVKNGDMEKYKYARDLAISSGYIDSQMSFT